MNEFSLLFEVQNVGDEAVSRTLAGLLSTLTRRDLSSLLCRTYRAAQLVAQQARQRQLKLSYRNIPEQPYRRANSMGPPAMNGVPFAMYASQLLSPVVSDRPLSFSRRGRATVWTASLHSVSM